MVVVHYSLSVLVEDGVAESVGVDIAEGISDIQVSGRLSESIHTAIMHLTITCIIKSKEFDFSHIHPVNWLSVKGHNNVEYVVRTWIW